MTATNDRARRIRPGLALAARRLVDFVLPPRCAACSAELVSPTALCPACWSNIDFIEQPYCAKLGIPFPYDLGPGALSAEALARDTPFDRVRAVARYGGSARKLVVALKFSDRVDVAPMMAKWMARSGAELLTGADILAPVPLHWLRLVRRRQNQSALLAKSLGRGAGLPVIPDLLRRRRHTRPQTGLSAGARKRNVEGAFAVRENYRERLAGAAVLLIDDVFTTGATATACARVLKRAGARRVDVLSFARVVGETQLAI